MRSKVFRILRHIVKSVENKKAKVTDNEQKTEADDSEAVGSCSDIKVKEKNMYLVNSTALQKSRNFEMDIKIVLVVKSISMRLKEEMELSGF